MIPTEPLQYLKEHIGCKYSIACYEKHKRRWSKGPKLTEADIKNYNINCCQELPNEITLESDYKDAEAFNNKENQDHAENILIKNGAGYYISSHNGKSDYLRFRFKTNQLITPKLRLAIIRYMAKPGLRFDENFYSLEYVRPVPNRTHWKHSTKIEKVIKIAEGPDLDIDTLGIKESKKPVKKIFSGSMHFVKIEDKKPKGWALSIKISKMAQRNNFNNCPECQAPLIFNDGPGFFKCSKCGLYGGLKTFAKLCLQKGGAAC